MLLVQEDTVTILNTLRQRTKTKIETTFKGTGRLALQSGPSWLSNCLLLLHFLTGYVISFDYYGLCLLLASELGPKGGFTNAVGSAWVQSFDPSNRLPAPFFCLTGDTKDKYWQIDFIWNIFQKILFSLEGGSWSFFSFDS